MRRLLRIRRQLRQRARPSGRDANRRQRRREACRREEAVHAVRRHPERRMHGVAMEVLLLVIREW